MKPERASAPLPLAQLLAIHALVWTLAAWLSRGNLDVPGDMVENYVWGVEWQLGYAKHPPLFAWVTAAWFSVFPRIDIAYFALSALNAAAGLLGVAALARRFLPRDDAALATLALALSPLYTALAIKFNANAVLLSTWPWAAYGFVAFMQGGRLRHAVLCGVFTALAILGKYFSVVLVLAFVIATVARPAWRARLRGRGPWLAIATGALVLLPHALWQAQNHFATFGYASQRSGGSWAGAVARYAKYSVAQVFYLLPSAVFLLLLVPRSKWWPALKGIAQSSTRPKLHADLWWLALSPLVAAGLLAVLARTPMASVWGMAQWFAVTTLWLVCWRQVGITPHVGRAQPLLLGYWALVLVASAVIGWQDARRGQALAAEPRAELARAARQAWQARTEAPLRIVGGGGIESASVAFYGDDRVRWWSLGAPRTTPWVTPEQVAREGALLVCREDDAECAAQAESATPVAAQLVDLHKRAWGRDLPSQRYRLYVVLPAKDSEGRGTEGKPLSGTPTPG